MTRSYLEWSEIFYTNMSGNPKMDTKLTRYENCMMKFLVQGRSGDDDEYHKSTRIMCDWKD